MSDDEAYYHMSSIVSAKQCHKKLRQVVDSSAKITINQILWGDGGYRVQAFHTCWPNEDEDSFAREVVEYDTHSEEYSHHVEHYFSGHHEEHYEYELPD